MKFPSLILLTTLLVFTLQENVKTDLNKDADAISHIIFNTIPKLVGSLQAKEKSPGIFRKAIGVIKRKAKSLKSKLKKTGEDENDRINEVVIAVGKSVEGMQEAMSTQDPQEFLLSCLDLVSSLASLTGPQGKLLSDILGILSGFIKMFQETPKVESQESMIKRVVETAIEDAQVENLQFEISGTLELYMILADSISNFRSNGNISQEQASEFYNHAFRSLVIFGKLKENIKKYCANGNEEGKTKEEKKKTLTIIERCLAFSSLYCKLSIARHSLLVNMAALINSDKDLDELTSTASNLLHLVRSEQSSNKETLRFFAEPMNHKPYRRVVAEFWQNQYKYPILGAYLQKLNVAFNNSLHNYKVMVCSGFMLSGACKEFPPGIFDGSYMEGWSNTIQSVFIPPGISVSAVIKGYSTDVSVHESRKVGPLFGPHVFGIVPGDQQWISAYKRWIKDVTPHKWYEYLNPFNKLHRKDYERALQKMRADWDSLLIKTSKNILARNRIMLCTEKNMGIQGLCQLIEPVAHGSSATYNLKNVYGINLVRTISSMHLPSGLELIAQGNGKAYGPFYGPGVYPEVCGLENWTSIKLNHVTKEMSSSKKVQVCSKSKFEGQCDFLDVGKYAYLDDIHGCDWTNKRINSAKLPYGITVFFYTGVNFYGKELGPYHGAAQFPYVDGYGLDDFAIHSIRIMKTKDYEKGLPECPFMGHVGFIFDGYQEDRFSQAKIFVKRMISNFKPGSNSVLASAFYLGDSTIVGDMNDGKDAVVINENIDRIVPSDKKKFSLIDGIRYAQQNMFLPNDDKVIPQILILITFDSDDKNETELNEHEIKDVGSELYDKGIQVIAVAHSSNGQNRFLGSIEESRGQVIKFKSINRLSEDVFLKKICHAVQKSVV